MGVCDVGLCNVTLCDMGVCGVCVMWGVMWNVVRRDMGCGSVCNRCVMGMFDVDMLSI